MPVLAVASLLLGMGNLGLNLLGYLQTTQPPAPPTMGYQAPYIPPFTGGQCVGVEYRVDWTILADVYGIRNASAINLVAPIKKIYFVQPTPLNTQWFARIEYGEGGVVNTYGGDFGDPNLRLTTVSGPTITRMDGLPDNCGNLPNPNPLTFDPDGGFANSAYPTTTPTEIVPSALPILAPSAIAAILAALRNAANLAVLAANLADALKTILDWIKEIDDKDSSKKAVVSRNLGAIERDGFLRLYPLVRHKSIAINLDLRFYLVPIWKRDTVLG